MAIELWTSRQLYLLRQDERNTPLPNWFLDTFFTQTHFSEEKEILIADLPEKDRFLAPFTLPYEQGRPMMKLRSEKLQAFTPPYIKLKDAVRPEDARNLAPSDIFRNSNQIPSLEQRFDARVAQLTEDHIRQIRVREIWMAVRAFVDGRVRIQYDRDQGVQHPDVMLDFGRDPGHTVLKTSDYWDDPDADILGDVEGWMKTQYLAYGGGSANMMIVGAQVAGQFRKNKALKEAMDKNYRNNDSVNVNLGILRTHEPMNFIGRLDSGLEIWAYKDTIDVPGVGGSKSKLDLFNEKDILLIAPGAIGVRAYGAIYDNKAMRGGASLSTDIFPKMFETDDPGETFVMHQSSPLPIPLYPNRTFKARVLA